MYRIQSRCFSLTWDNICVSQRKLIAEWRVDMNTEIKCQEMSCCSVAQSCLTLCDPRGCSMPGFPVLHCLLELLKLMSIDSVMLSNLLILSSFSSCLQSFPTSGSFSMSQFFPTGGQSIGASASASVLPMNIQD